MKKVFIIDGGAGRVITAIPALERYVTEHPEEDVKILIHGWDYLLWSNKLLQDKTFNIYNKGVFDSYIKNADDIVSPEPYRLPAYIRQEVSLVEAFDILINGNAKNKIPKLFLSKSEIAAAKSIIVDVKKYQNKQKTIVIQPFGSTANFFSDGKDDDIVDSSVRSMSIQMFSLMVKTLSGKFNIILFADQKFHFKEDNFTYKLNGDLRTHMSVISVADYFVGCDSVGQHMARAFNVPGTVIFGSMFPENVSYPDWFRIVDKYKGKKTFSPLRINDIDAQMADRNNEKCMDYTEKEILEICSNIVKDIETKSKK